MKKVIAILTTAVVFAACSKKDKNDNQPDPPNQSKKYAVQFNVTGFSQVTGDFNERKGLSVGMGRTAADTLSQYINYLIYNVYDAVTNSRLKAIYQTSKDSTFGQIRDSLPPGRYVITVTASKDSVFMSPSKYDYVYSPEETTRIDLSYPPGTDLFFKKISLSVDDVVNQKFELERVVSKLKIIIKDKIPFNTRTIQLWMFTDAQSLTPPCLPSFFDFLKGVTFGRQSGGQYQPCRVQIPDSLKGKTDFQFETYVINMGTTKTVLSLVAIDTLNRAIASKKIQNVTLEANRKTVLAGTLFGDPGSGVNVGLTPQWRTDSIYGEF